MKPWVAAAALLASAATGRSAAIVFDDFNLGEGHFRFIPNFSGTNAGVDPSSTAEHDPTDSIEASASGDMGSQVLTLVHDSTADPFRLRHLSGDTTSSAGNPLGNVPFITSFDIDGFIGFYVKTTVPGWAVSINLDTPANTGATMIGSLPIPAIADGQWHLYEWDLDAFSDDLDVDGDGDFFEPIWVAVPGINSSSPGFLPDETYTIDSIHFRDVDGIPDVGGSVLNLDFVAKSNAGSIALLIPEPASCSLVAIGLLGLASRRRSRR